MNYLVSAGPCIVVLGIDRHQIEYCVGLGFEKLVDGLPEDELIYGSSETPDKSGKQRAFARHYLEKMINIEVPVPALDDAGPMPYSWAPHAQQIWTRMTVPVGCKGPNASQEALFRLPALGLWLLWLGCF